MRNWGVMFRFSTISSCRSPPADTSKPGTSRPHPSSESSISSSASGAEAAGAMELWWIPILQVCRIGGEQVQSHCEQPHCRGAQVVWTSVGLDPSAHQRQFLHLPCHHQGSSSRSEDRLHLHPSFGGGSNLCWQVHSRLNMSQEFKCVQN